MKALALTVLLFGCGPACPDARCSLTSTSTHVDRADYSHLGNATPDGGTLAAATPDAGVPAKPVGPGSGSGSAVGPGSGAGSGSAVAAVQPGWSVFDNPADHSRILIQSKTELPAGTTIKFEFVKVPDAPFAIHLEAKKPGGGGETLKIWNDCPPEKLRCDVAGMKSFVTKAAGQLAVVARTNWSITAFTDEGPFYLITWKNNLSQDVLMLRFYK